MKTSKQIRDAFVNFWTAAPRSHALIPNVSLVPNIDSTLLFVNSGMFPIAKYLAGEAKHPQGNRLCNTQRCLRTKYDDMIEIGDNRHTLMFEMLGNWSIGDYFKKEQIPWVLDLHVEHYGLDPNRLYVTVWGGDDVVGRDDEAIELWKEAFKKYGIDAEFSDDITNIPATIEDGKTHKFKIFPYGKSDNWWQRGEAPGELGGPCSEMFYDTGIIERDQDKYHVNDDSGRFLEIGNSVFMEYRLDDDLNWVRLEQSNVDFGGGLERVVMCAQDKQDIFETDIYMPILKKIEEISGKNYRDYKDATEGLGSRGAENEYTAAFRVLADHGRAATFILADGVTPSNKDQGYILRRFIRRLVRFGKKLEIQGEFTKQIAEAVISAMGELYGHLVENKAVILEKIEQEEQAFNKTLNKGLKEIEKMKNSGEQIDGKKAFWIYETYGFPFELTLDELGVDEDTAEQIEEDFKKAETAHRNKSRQGAEKKFKGGLADQTVETTRLHSAHHILLAALQEELGHHVHQKGSNITGERLRIDFSHDAKLTPEQVERVEARVNQVISKGYHMFKKTLPREIAEKLGAEMEFGAKYGDLVDVYFIVEPDVEIDRRNPDLDTIPAEKIFSKEFCGGPHVENTNELAESGVFKIKKQESSGAGIRRIKGILV